MTEPNIVRTRRQRIEAGNPGSWSGALPKHYIVSIQIFCVAMH